MEIVTTRLLLREFSSEDEPAFAAYHADPRHRAFYGPDEAVSSPPRALLRRFTEWAAERPRRNHQLAIGVRRPAPALLGCCGLRGAGLEPGVAEFGIELAPDWWGRGYAHEAALALLGWGFRELALAEVRGITVSANARIERLVRRLGFTVAATRPGPAWMQPRGWSEVEWRLTRARWAERALA